MSTSPASRTLSEQESRLLSRLSAAGYTLRLRNGVSVRRLGFWLELLELGDEAALSRLEDDSSHSYARLEPAGAREGRATPAGASRNGCLRNMSAWLRPWRLRPILRIRMPPGSGEPMRTPMACCANTSPKKVTSRRRQTRAWLGSMSD